MNQRGSDDADLPPFGRYLKDAIKAAGFKSPTAFARAAGPDPSVVLRWIQGKARPSLATLHQVAPTLKVPAADLLAAAYPEEAAPLPAFDDGPPASEVLAAGLDSATRWAGDHANPLTTVANLLQAERREELARRPRKPGESLYPGPQINWLLSDASPLPQAEKENVAALLDLVVRPYLVEAGVDPETGEVPTNG